jgi:hypothetical protein
MPWAEILLFKKALKGVVKFFLTRLAAFILKKVKTVSKSSLMVVQSHQNDAEDGAGKDFRGMGRVCQVFGLPRQKGSVEADQLVKTIRLREDRNKIQ